MARTYNTYKDEVSGEILYVRQSFDFTEYYKDKAMTVLHRRDGPAFEDADGCKSWFVNGTLHRLNGPAVEYAGRRKSWWVDGVLITFITSNGKYKGPTQLQCSFK
jgi:hypothetical protein